MPDPTDRLSAALADRYRVKRVLGAGWETQQLKVVPSWSALFRAPAPRGTL